MNRLKPKMKITLENCRIVITDPSIGNASNRHYYEDYANSYIHYSLFGQIDQLLIMIKLIQMMLPYTAIQSQTTDSSATMNIIDHI
jgi:hypothetical protein